MFRCALFVFSFATATPSAAEPCVEAWNHYKNLDIEKALKLAVENTSQSESPPSLCLQVQALSHMILGQSERAGEVLRRLFDLYPEHVIDDPSLSPSMADMVNNARVASLGIKANAGARWIDAASLQLKFLIEGRVSDTQTLRYDARFPQSGDLVRGELFLKGRVNTATVPVISGADISSVEINGLIRTKDGAVIHQFTERLLLEKRPKPIQLSLRKNNRPWYKSWWVWTAVTTVAVGAGVASYYAIDARNPDCPGGLGCFEVGLD